MSRRTRDVNVCPDVEAVFKAIVVSSRSAVRQLLLQRNPLGCDQNRSNSNTIQDLQCAKGPTDEEHVAVVCLWGMHAAPCASRHRQLPLAPLSDIVRFSPILMHRFIYIYIYLQ